jgi:diguanylate cyclase (GGDEF)-like protein
VNRSFELLARYGGEEFIAVLPETDEKGALAVAHNMIASIEDLKIPHEFSEASQYVTVSVGCAAMRASNSFSPEKLVEKADEALYTAKQTGRNRAAAVAADTYTHTCPD